MHVVATAGHVDHGKSTLVQALTGTDPDRLAEEKRRGLTIELGFAWTRLGSGGDVAFVDVPGHQRFLATMLAGVGPVPAALLVVAADEGWRRQTGEHLAALRALGVRHAVVAVSRCDLADPASAEVQVREQLRSTALAGAPVVAVSATTGHGLDALRDELGTLVAGLPTPDPAARVRLWVDRVFSVVGTGTVVTGTLPAGTLRVGDELEVRDRRVRVRGLESLGVAQATVGAVARVAVALRGVERAALRRGDALLTPGAWSTTSSVDVRLSQVAGRLPAQLVLHVGARAVPARVRRLGDPAETAQGAAAARITLAEPLPLTPGDRALLRDPGRQSVAAGVLVLDADPPPLRRRGSARSRAADLAGADEGVDVAAEVIRRGSTTRRALEAGGVLAPGAPAPPGVLDIGDHLVSAARWDSWRGALTEVVAAHAREHPVETGVPRALLPGRLGLPSPTLLAPLLAAVDGVVDAGGGRLAPRDHRPALPPGVASALARLRGRWAADPFGAPAAEELRELGLDPRVSGALAAGGHLLRLPGDVLLPPDAALRAVAVLSALAQPFTVSEARAALGTSRRVAVPLLEHLDADRRTRRLDAAHREVVRP